MAIFANILDRIREKKKEMVLSSHDAYYSLLKDVASAKEVDADEAAMVLDAVGKTEDQFEADVQTMESRFGWDADLKARRKLESQLPGLQAKLDAAKLALDEAVRKLTPVVNLAWDELNDVQNRQTELIHVEARLSGCCLNETLLTRERELSAQRKDLLSKRSPLAEDLRAARAFAQTIQAYVDSTDAKVASTYKPEVQAARVERRKYLAQQEQQERLIAQLAEAVSQLDTELSPLDAEMKVLANRKLVP